MITPVQCRAARALLGVSQSQLAEWAGVGLRSLQGFERGERQIQSLAIEAVERILQREGIVLITEPGWTGVKLDVSRRAFEAP